MHPALSVVLVALALLLANANESDNEILSNEPNGDAVTSGEHVAGSEKNTNENADASVGDLFETAVRSYLDEEWDNCVDGFHRAFERYKEYKSVVTKCRRSCRVEAKGSKRIFTEDVEDLHFYEKKIRETLCLMKCKQRNEEILGAAALKDLPLEVELKFAERRGYEYLHICLHQKKRYQDAANALFTFMILHPEHELSLKNLRFYAALPEVKENQVVNLEADPFLRMYVAGVSAYDAEDYEETVDQLENSLRAYLDAEENCRAYCEGPFNQGWFPEFTSSIANHFTYCLKCKRSCSHQLNNFNGEYQHDLLPSHYHYLQFAYFKLGKVKEACAAVESYLSFFPVDETNLHNKEYFLELPEVKPEYFKPREEALSYVKRREYELRLLLYIQEEFAAIDTKRPVPPQEDKKKEEGVDKKEQQRSKPRLPSTPSTLHPPPGHSPSSQVRVADTATMIEGEREAREDRNREAVRRLKNRMGVRVIAGEKELGGKLRYEADGFLNSTECDFLLQLAQIAAIEGDGYEGNKSPHSTHEKFEGVTLGRTAILVYFGLVEPELLELFLQVTEASRDHVERYFNLDRQLYFTYTHLVCRSALPGSPLERKDPSHPIHADNCLVDRDGGCIRESPAFTWRDYSAIVYLNDDFEGGEFIFSKDRMGHVIQGTVRPHCGRMVAFSADGENLHGVRGVVRGKRCAVALWFTHDESHLEVERVLARAVLKRVKTDGFMQAPDNGDINMSDQYEEILMSRFREDETLSQLLQN